MSAQVGSPSRLKGVIALLGVLAMMLSIIPSSAYAATSLPPGSCPQLYDTYAQALDNKVTIHFNHTLDTDSVPATSAFLLRLPLEASTPTDVTVSGDKVILTMPWVMRSGSWGEVEVKYTPPATNPIQDISGNQAVAFHQWAQNASPPTLTWVTVSDAILEIGYDQGLEEWGDQPATGDFIVKAGGEAREVVNVSVAYHGVTLSLAAPVLGSDVVTVSYKPGTNPVKGQNGSPVAGYTDQPVTNVTVNPGAPTLDALNVVSDKITLTYSDVLDGGSMPAPGDFTAKVNSVKRPIVDVVISDTTVVLTLDSPVVAHQWVDLGYQAGTSAIQNSAGIRATGFPSRGVQNDTPDVSAPELMDAHAYGNRVFLTYNEELALDSGDAYGSFTIKVNGTATAPIGGVAGWYEPEWGEYYHSNELILTLAEPIPFGATLTVGYTPSTAAAVTDRVGNAAGNVTGFRVRNETQSPAPRVYGGTVNESTIRLSFDKDLDPASVPTTSAFTVTYAYWEESPALPLTGAVSISGNTVTLTLDSPIEFDRGDLAVKYAPPAENPIRDSSGNVGESFYADVQNITPPTVERAQVQDSVLRIFYGGEAYLSDGAEVDAGNFAVSVNGVAQTPNQAWAEYNYITLTLAAPVRTSDRVTVSYNPVGDPIRVGYSGGELAPYTDYPVENRTIDPDAPAFQNATVDGDTLTLTYTDVLDGSSAPAPTDFEVNVNAPHTSSKRLTPERVAISGNQVVLTLASSVSNWDGVSVSYRPGTHPLLGADGHQAAGLYWASASNITPDTMGPGAVRLDVYGTSIDIYFDEPIRSYDESTGEPVTLDPGAFAVSINGASRTPTGISVYGGDPDSGSGDYESRGVVVLTVDTQINYGDTVKVSYTPSESALIQDVVGNAAPALSNRDADTRYAIDRCVPSMNPAPASSVPTLTSLDKNSMQKGSPNLTLTVSGTGFDADSTVQWAWNGTTSALPTTYVSGTALRAEVSGDKLGAAGTAEIKVTNSLGSSAPIPLFITDTAASVTSSSSGTLTNGSASVAVESSSGSISAEASGTSGGVSLAQYSGSPVPLDAPADPSTTPNYFDVYVAANSELSTLTIKNCDLGAGNTVYWWDGAAWVPVSDQSYDAGPPACVTMTLDTSSSPNLTQLAGTPFAALSDRMAPVLTVPSNQNVTATSATGAAVSYTATANDSIDGSVTPVCTPTSGVFPLGKTQVSCTAMDRAGNTSTKSFDVTVSYSWSGILQPVNADGSSIFKLGTTVPIKFALTGASAPVTNATARLSYSKLTSKIDGSVVESAYTLAGDSGGVFRYDQTSKQYIYNLSTKGWTGGSYQLKVDLGDGVVRTVVISLK